MQTPEAFLESLIHILTNTPSFKDKQSAIDFVSLTSTALATMCVCSDLAPINPASRLYERLSEGNLDIYEVYATRWYFSENGAIRVEALNTKRLMDKTGNDGLKVDAGI